jgi:hypothetical protein
MRLPGDWRRSLLWLGIVLVMLAWAPGAWAQTDIPASVLTTASLTKGQARSGTIDRAGDADWYELVLREANAYQITVTGPAEIRIYDYAGALKASSGTKQYYVWGAPLTGTYFIAAQGKGTRTGAYTIKVNVYEHAAGPTTEGKLTVGRVTTGKMTNSGRIEDFGTANFPADEDWLAFQLKTAGCYLLELRMDSILDWLRIRLYQEFVPESNTYSEVQAFSQECREGCTGSRGIVFTINEDLAMLRYFWPFRTNLRDGPAAASGTQA